MLGRLPKQGWFKVSGFAALAVSLVPIVTILPRYGIQGATFRPSEYLTWGPGIGLVEIKRDLMLEPTLPEIRLDFYQGHGAGPRPLLVLVHGGSFSGGDKGENNF